MTRRAEAGPVSGRPAGADDWPVRGLLNQHPALPALWNNWTHNFDFSAAVDGNTATITVGGKTIMFQRDGGDWALSSTEKLDHQLQDAEAGGLLFLDLSTTRIYTFDAAGRLTRIEDRNEQRTYRDPGRQQSRYGHRRAWPLTRVHLPGSADARGGSNRARTLSSHDTGDDLTTFTDAKGVTTTYTYTAEGDVEGLMTTSTLPDRQPTQHPNLRWRRPFVDAQTDGEGNVIDVSIRTAPQQDRGHDGTSIRSVKSASTFTDGQNLVGATDDAATQTLRPTTQTASSRLYRGSETRPST